MDEFLNMYGKPSGESRWSNAWVTTVVISACICRLKGSGYNRFHLSLVQYYNWLAPSLHTYEAIAEAFDIEEGRKPWRKEARCAIHVRMHVRTHAFVFRGVSQ